MPTQIRQLAAIMFTDIVGYTAMMQANETEGKRKARHYRKILSEQVMDHDGKIIQNYGDGSLTIFNSAVNATKCAIALQKVLKENPTVPLKIGIHLGDIEIDGEDIFGDGINVASRIESMGVEGAVMVSQSVYNQIKNHPAFLLQSLGSFAFKNVSNPMDVYAVANKGLIVPEIQQLEGKFANDNHAEKSIAVLPFVNMSNDPEQEFFSDGISEEIINTIVQLPNLKVTGRTSSFSFKGKNEDLRVIGKKLGVKNILEGSVRKSANKVRVTAQLVEASTGFHLWSRKYDREVNDVFIIQDEIALEIAEQLKLTFTKTQSVPKSRQQTESIEAYQLYYKGRSFFYKRGTYLFDALRCFQAALQIDPDYALACSGLADTYIMLSFHGLLHPSQCWPKAIPAAHKALKYGADLGETHNTLAIIALLHDYDLNKAETAFKRALEINPTHIQASVWYGLFYLTLTKSNFKDGNKQLKIAIQNDPLSAYAHACFSMSLSTSGKIEKSIEMSKYAVELDPNSMLTRYALAYSYLWSGNLKLAIAENEIALEVSNRHVWILHQTIQSYIKNNQHEEALKIFKEMEARYRDHYLPPSNLAIAAAALNKNETAIQLLYEALDIVDPYLAFVMTKLKEVEVLQKVSGFDQIKKKMKYKVEKRIN